ncbi:hypothetical protein [Pseudogracilibacillus sp. SO30301A]|uniref:hypothetical protein n=1 Tax=Pseudogracilibacillus sp. SO30301A TaxID=3098291 RepID=UPI00300DCEB1
MRKYWKSIFLITFIVVVVGIFYIKADTVSNSFAQFKFEKKEGNDAAVEELVVNGDMLNGMFSYEPFRIDNQGTTYLRDESFIKRLSGVYPDMYIERLQKEHRKFMRGKVEEPKSYYEDENVLAYGATPYEFWTADNFKFDIAVLDKKTNDTVSFSLPIPNRADYWYVEPYGVLLDGKELSIITVNEATNNAMVESVSAQAHIYTFDIEKEQLINEEIIGSLDYTDDSEGYSDYSIFKDGDSVIIAGLNITPVEYDEELEYDEEPEYYEEVGELTKLYIYNIKNKDVEEISISEKEDIGIPISKDGDQLYFANVKNNQLSLSTLNTKTKKVTDTLEIDDIKSYMSIDEIQQAEVKNGKWYFVPSTQNIEGFTPIIVVDLSSLSLDYIGQIVNTKPPENNETSEIYFNFLELK